VERVRGRTGDHVSAGTPLRALLLDFDGLVVDTETTDFESWRLVYEEHGAVLPRDRWVAIIGSDGSGFEPFEHLCELVGEALDEEDVGRRRRAHRERLFEALSPLPGIPDWMSDARETGLALGIVSSSPGWWVEEHLERVALRDYVDFTKTRDDVSRVKPHPDLYLEALAHTGARAHEALAVEDSPNGVAAAKAAGLFVVAVPGPMTRGLDFAAADLVLDSLAARRLASVLALLRGSRG
jgi:HAD superfamily hydrolase (TIGR01509 family)